MAKGVFGALKGLDAFGKVSSPHPSVSSLPLEKLMDDVDYGRCESEDPHRCSLYVVSLLFVKTEWG